MGPTGSGKSKLAIDLAKKFLIPIINADSLQIYKTPTQIMTAKPTASDMQETPHLLYDFLPLS